MLKILKKSIKESIHELFFNESNSSFNFKEIIKKSLKDLFF